MKVLPVVSILVLALSLPLMQGQGCVPDFPTDADSIDTTDDQTITDESDANDAGTDDPSENTDPSDAELKAVDVAIDAIEALAQAINTTQNAADQGDVGFGQVLPSTCPTIATSEGFGDAFGLSVFINFGTVDNPCTLPGTDDYTCSGTAGASVNLQSGTITVDFNDLNCGEDVLTGSATVTFGLQPPQVILTGQWDLTKTGDEGTIRTAGEGATSFDRTQSVTTISTFDGAVSDGSQSWQVTLTGIQLSRVNNGSFVPFGGTAVVSADHIPTVTIEFNEDSPTTGQVQVQIGVRPPLTVNLFDL